jgi:toluene monooxygenase system protein B
MSQTQESSAAPAPDPEPEGQPVPINALFENDFVTQLILVLDTDTIDEAAQKVAYHAVGRRVPPRDAGLVMRVGGQVIPGHLTVAEAGIAPLGNVLVGWAG